MKTSMKFENPFALLFLLLVTLALTLTLNSCDDDDDSDRSREKEYTVKLTTDQEIPPVKDRTETGNAIIRIFSDSTLEFELSASNLAANDALTMAHIHSGGPVDAGAPIVTLVDNSTIKFNGTNASGSVKLNKSQYENLSNKPDSFYVNIHSTTNPLGLLRGQLEMEFIFSANVDLVPISNPLRPETGLAVFRLTKDSTLVYKITVNNLTSGDKLMNAALHVGAAGITGPELIPLATEDGFNTKKSLKLTSSQVNFVMNSEIYVNVTSEQNNTELVRGQIR